VTLTRKILVIVIGVFFLLLAISAACFSRILFVSYRNLENRLVEADLLRAEKLLFEEVRGIDTIAWDWASWDDTYRFMHDNNPGFLEGNLLDSAFDSLRLNLILFLDTRGRSFYCKGYDLKQEDRMTVPRSFLKRFEKNGDLNLLLSRKSSGKADKPVRGLLHSPAFGRLLLVAARPILTSEDEGPSRGTLVMARFLSPETSIRLEELSGVGVTIRSISDTPAPERILVLPLDSKTIWASKPLRDVRGRFVAGLSIETGRETFIFQKVTVLWLVGILVFLGIVFAALLFGLLRRMVASRLEGLQNAVRALGDADGSDRRLPVEGNDELTRLARSINETLDRLERLDGERNELQEQLYQKEKMEALGRLAGGVAHDFNNQLSAIGGYAEMLVDSLEDPKLKRYAETILKSADRSSELTEQILAFSRRGRKQSIPVNMHQLVNDVIAILERTLEKRIRLDKTWNAEKVFITGDPSLLQNALLNLALNARDAVEGSGKIFFEGETLVFELTEEIGDFRIPPGEYLRITVGDTGRGMPPEVQKRVFEPFFTTKKRGAGIGMGLAAVYGTVQSHSGAIRFHSAPGKGTRFDLFFPVCPVVEPEKASAEPSRELCGNARLLVIEDEEGVRSMLGDLLSRYGYRAVFCADGREGIARFTGQKFDLVILDMVLPGMSGGETFRKLVEIDPGVKVLLVSGYTMQTHTDSQEIFGEKQVMGFVKKPFRSRAFLETLVSCLE
jgi:signal transduction histidine kinase